MNLAFRRDLSIGHQSRAQVARVLTEAWFGETMFCVACGHEALRQFPPGTHARDFWCPACQALFELKSASKPFGPTVPDGAYGAMMNRLAQEGGGANLALLHYDVASATVRNLVLVPGAFLTAEAIEPRRPLGPGARRAGWVGCNIRLASVPASGRVAVVTDGQPRERGSVRRAWRRAAGLEAHDLGTRTWMVDVLRCIEGMGRREFSIADAYGFEAELQGRHPANRHVRPKIRQQLQRLRDAGLVTFLGGGRYRFEGCDTIRPGAG